MKKAILFAVSLFVLMSLPMPAMARVNVDIGIGLPPLIVGAPPDVVELPDAPGVYVAPEIGVNLFFWNGWWWRPWEGRWYRSHYYDRGWGFYRTRSPPGFYRHVNPGWRGFYRDRRWNGRAWNYRRIPHRQFRHRR